MKKLISIIVLAIFSGCSTLPKHSAAILLSPIELQRIVEDQTDHSFREWYYVGSDYSYHYFYTFKPSKMHSYGEMTYKTPKEQIVLGGEFPFTTNRDGWIRCFTYEVEEPLDKPIGGFITTQTKRIYDFNRKPRFEHAPPEGRGEAPRL